MTRPQPQTVASTLQTEINEFLDKVTHTDACNQVVLAGLISEATELQGKGGQVVEGSLMRASLYSASGQFLEAERMFRNAEHNHGYAPARIGRFQHFVNHGYAGEAMKLADLTFANRDTYNFVEIACLVVTAGGFKKVVEKLDESQGNQEVLKMTSTVLDLARRGAEVLALLDVSDAKMAAMLDMAGERLRAKSLYWQGRQPDITVLQADQGGPALLYEYRVLVSPQESARMTWDLTEALVGHDLDAAGVHIGFVGTDLPARLAA